MTHCRGLTVCSEIVKKFSVKNWEDFVLKNIIEGGHIVGSLIIHNELNFPPLNIQTVVMYFVYFLIDLHHSRPLSLQLLCNYKILLVQPSIPRMKLTEKLNY